MKLVNTANARSLWFFPTEDLNPRGLDLIPVFVGIKARYQFQLFPSKPEDIFNASDGIQYGKGTFRLNDNQQQIGITKFTIYNDGLVADTRFSSTATDEFLSDLLSFVSTNHNLTFDSRMVKKKGYLSELVVTSDIELGAINAGLRRFSDMLTEATGEGLAFSASALHFGTDPANPGAPLRFAFERRGGHPFSEKRYYSSAPVTTEKHLELLDAFERLLIA